MRRPARWLPIVLVATIVACAPSPAPGAPGAPAAPAQPVASSAPERPATDSSVSPTPLPRRQVKVAYPSASLAQMDFMYAEDTGMYARYGVDVESVLLVPTPAVAVTDRELNCVRMIGRLDQPLPTGGDGALRALR